jgi:adenine-specific DNA-methyltransferase
LAVLLSDDTSPCWRTIILLSADMVFHLLTVLSAKMNPDLAMGDELLKKIVAGNLFMVFGEPDVDITKQQDGRIVVEIKWVERRDKVTG